MKNRGSAIIIAFFLMAAVSGVAFSIGRLFYLDTSTSGIYENSTIAYYAAESGIEESFLRYRTNRQSEVGTVDSMAVNRTNLNDLTVSPGVSSYASLSSIVNSASKSIYDLSLGYKAKFYGTDANSDGVFDENDLKSALYGAEFTILRDESVKIDITDSIGGDIKLYAEFTPGTCYSNPPVTFTKNSAFVEARVVGYRPIGSGPTCDKSGLCEYKKILVTTLTNPACAGTPDSCIAMQNVAGSDIYTKESLRNYVAGAVNFMTAPNRVFLYIRPIGCNIKIGISPKPSSYYIAAPYSTVKSTGYYGNIGRTLEAKIDRQSGTVYDLFDFVVNQIP